MAMTLDDSCAPAVTSPAHNTQTKSTHRFIAAPILASICSRRSRIEGFLITYG